MFEVEYGNTVQISFRVRSEDAGEDLAVAIYVDYGATPNPDVREKFMGDFDIAAGPFDKPKTIPYSFTPRRGDFDPGCHTLTILVMHTSNFDRLTDLPVDGSESDQAMVVWWFNVTDPNFSGTPDVCP
jgi:hypothetical protein